MITLLQIENIILIESTTIPFRKGLNILSGETGAGKTAIMQALKLIAGEKFDPKIIRHGTEKASVAAEFQLSKSSLVWTLLDEAGFDLNREEPLIIRRELPAQGKSRIFINHKLASLSLLKEVGDLIFDIASQHASQKMGMESFQRESLDRFGDLESLVDDFSKNWQEEQSLKETLKNLKETEAHRLREIESKKREIEEIESAKLDPEEEEPLFKEYSDLATSEERTEVVEKALSLLEAMPVVDLKNTLETLADLDSETSSLLELSSQAKIELDEITWELNRYRQKITFSPEKMSCLNDRLKEISKLKKKYGSSIEEILSWKQKQEKELLTLSFCEERIEEINNLLSPLSIENKLKCETITKKRKETAQVLGQNMTEELRSLNMDKAKFYINIEPKAISRSGQDQVLFLFQPNPGGKELSVKEAASGGELARIFLSLKTLLQQKEGSSSLIFDEVDANIGGKTAKLLGEKLKALGKNSQVIAITHFPQVAEFADHHLRVRKIESMDETRSIIEELTVNDRSQELARMVGSAT